MTGWCDRTVEQVDGNRLEAESSTAMMRASRLIPCLHAPEKPE